MVVVSMTRCPPKLRGDLSKWLLEINTGVYVGQVSARVRDALWKRICDNIGDGQATLVFSTNNEQHMDFYVHNTSWRPIDLDGLKLMKRPLAVDYSNGIELQLGFSNAAKRRMQQRRRRFSKSDSYMIMAADISTECCVCGLIAQKYTKNNLVDEFRFNVDATNDSKNQKALSELIKFIGVETVYICSNEKNLDILELFFEKNGFCFADIRYMNLSLIAEKKIPDLKDYSFESLASYLGLNLNFVDCDKCKIINDIHQKLNE